MRWKAGTVIVGIALAAAGWAAGSAQGGGRTPYAQTIPAPPGDRLSMLTYNVEGLPWPLALGRSADLREIGTTLRAERQAGRGPHVIALQEAFGTDAKAIGRTAGFAHAVFGPGAAAAPHEVLTESDRRFVAGASFWSGEGGTKRLDSGLAIFSDYPVLWARRIAFPDFACAGWDCLANKGILAAALKMPGSAEPLVVVDTHLNARIASGVADSRSDYAYRRQIDILGAVIGRIEAAHLPLVLAGDFNVGFDPVRRRIFSGMLQTHGLAIAVSEQRCGDVCRHLNAVEGTNPGTGKAMILYRPAGPLHPSSLGSFESVANRGRLSDHIGLAAQFALAAV